MRESLRQVAARHVGALAIAGMLAVPLFATQGRSPALARDAAPAKTGSAAVTGSGITGSGISRSGITGSARVIDGDTIDVAGVRVRLEGIDAPESDQRCPRVWLGTWACGREATEHLARLLRDRTVSCRSSGLDAYQRMLGVCTVEGLEINADMVRQGLAWAFVKYSQSYVAVEADARAARRGIWQGNATPAWQWRAERWRAAESEKREENGVVCLIKGNIGRGGQLYHMPWDRWYDKTRIETHKGERWFCTETEAAAAGWRPAVQR